ncbi:MAG: hypothetical protein Kow0031_25880 [Anaerolineae bacterium]
MPARANPALPTNLAYGTETTWLLPGLPALSAAAGVIPHTFTQNETSFPLNGQAVPGFRAGQDDPAMRLRELPWSLATAQYFYPDDYLRQPVEAFLRQQQPTGAIPAALPAPGQPAGDEALGLIHAAYLYYRINYNTAWLMQPLNGAPVIERLNRAADQLLARRLDAATGLLQRGPTLPGGEATFAAGGNSAALHDQALAYQSLLQLARMNAAVGDTTRADAWQAQAEAIKDRANALLWQPERGVYRLRLPLTAPEPAFDDSSLVSSDNALAVAAGLADDTQSEAIFAGLERARQQAGVGQPGLSLYPFYPAETFVEPGNTPGNGQNGGVWDWWGSLQISAEFQRGHAEMARRHLLHLANSWQKQPGSILQWQSATDPARRGSANFTAGAGAAGSAIIGGLFGVDLGGHGLALTPRLGLNDGYIRVYQPATDRYAAYSYDWDQTVTRLDYGTNAGGSVTIRLLKLASEQVSGVTLNGAPAAFSEETVGQDTYVVVTAPAGQHRLEIIKNQPAAQVDAPPPGDAFKAGSPGVVRNEVAPRQPPPAATLPPPTGDAPSAAARTAQRTQQALLQFGGALLVGVTSLGLLLLGLLRRKNRLAFAASPARRPGGLGDSSPPPLSFSDSQQSRPNQTERRQ